MAGQEGIFQHDGGVVHLGTAVVEDADRERDLKFLNELHDLAHLIEASEVPAVFCSRQAGSQQNQADQDSGPCTRIT